MTVRPSRSLRAVFGALLLILPLALPLAVGAAPAGHAGARNLAYESDFVWRLADTLGAAMRFVVKSLDPQMSAEFEAEAERQFSIIHFHLLVECGGPLPALAQRLQGQADAAPQDGRPLAVDVRALLARPDVAQVVNDWHAGQRSRVLRMFADAGYGFLPACVEPAFLAQNPALRP